MGSYNKRSDDKLANNTNLTIKIIGFLIVSLISVIAFGVNISVDIAKTVGSDIRTIRDTVAVIQQDNKLNSQAIITNKENIKRHEMADNARFEKLNRRIQKYIP